MTVREKRRQFVVDSFLFDQADGLPSDNGSLLAARILSSTDVLELVAFVEREFGLQVRDQDLVPDNFDSIERLTAFIKSRIAVESEESPLCR